MSDFSDRYIVDTLKTKNGIKYFVYDIVNEKRVSMFSDVQILIETNRKDYYKINDYPYFYKYDLFDIMGLNVNVWSKDKKLIINARSY